MKLSNLLKKVFRFLNNDEDTDVRILQQGSYLTMIGINGKQEYHVCFSPDTRKISLIDKMDNNPRKYIYIEDIGEIRIGCRTAELHSARQAINQNDKDAIKRFEDRCFSLHVSEGGNTIYSFLACNRDVARRWTRVLTLLLSQQSLECARQTVCNPSYWLRRVFREADVHHKGYLTLKQCVDLLRSKFHVAMDEKRVEALFHAASTIVENHEPQHGLNQNEFLLFFQMASYRPELDQLYYDLIGNDMIKTLQAEKLLEFLTQDQKVANLDLDKIREIITKYDPPIDGIPLTMSLNGFRSMMVSELFDIRKEEHRKINQPMDRPMSHYWIKSSHSTYLLTDELMGKSSNKRFHKGFDKRCGCVELSLWDGPGCEPVIYHDGRKILALDALHYGILPFALIKDYPTVLYIDDHLSDDQRKNFLYKLLALMAEHVFIVSANDLTSLPSPNQLKRKVIFITSNEKWGKLTNMCQKFHFPRDVLKKDEKVTPVTHVSSLSEDELDRLLSPTLIERMVCNKKSAELRRQKMRELTARQQIRVYPGVQSQLCDNYNPIDAINAGCQMAAMNNVQTKPSNMAIYEGRFRANGDCGYALKPDFLIDPSAARVGPKRVKIKIISGQNLPSGSKKSNPFVSVRVDGEKCDKIKRKTAKVKGNILNPVWDTEMTFDVKEPELGVILFQAKQNDGLFGWHTSTLGSFALPVLSLASGYRHIPLHDKNMVPLSLATLFVKVTIEDI